MVFYGRFYFRIRNAKSGQKVLFNVVNLCKTKSLYREGMGPVVMTKSNPKWERLSGKSVFYYKSPVCTSGPPPSICGNAWM